MGHLLTKLQYRYQLIVLTWVFLLTNHKSRYSMIFSQLFVWRKVVFFLCWLLVSSISRNILSGIRLLNFVRRKWILIFYVIREGHRILLCRNCHQLKRILLVRGRRDLFYLIFGICNFSMVLKDLSEISLYVSITILSLVLSQKCNLL